MGWIGNNFGTGLLAGLLIALAIYIWRKKAEAAMLHGLAHLKGWTAGELEELTKKVRGKGGE